MSKDILVFMLAVLCYALGNIHGHRAGILTATGLALKIRRLINEEEKNG